MAPAIGVGLGMSFCRAPIAADADALSVIARMTVQPDKARATLIETLVRDLKSAGVWQTLDGLYVMAAHDAQAARLNWRGNILNLTPAASPTFTIDRGYKGDGAAAYLTIDGTSTDVVRYTLDSASVGLWANQVVAETGIALGMSPDYALQIIPLSGSETLTIRFQNVSGAQSTTVIAGHDGLGMSRGTREASDRYFVRSRGRARIPKVISTTPGNPTRWPRRFLSGMANGTTMTYSTARIAVAYFGGALTDAQEVAMDAALQSYLSAVGGA